MGVIAEIVVALEEQLKLVPNVPAIAWPNIGYTPAPQDYYLEPKNFPATPRRLGLADVGSVRRGGLYVIEVHGPADAGAGGVDDLVDSINTSYSEASDLTTSGGHTVKLTNVTVDAGRRVTGYWVVPVSVAYTCVTGRV